MNSSNKSILKNNSSVKSLFDSTPRGLVEQDFTIRKGHLIAILNHNQDVIMSLAFSIKLACARIFACKELRVIQHQQLCVIYFSIQYECYLPPKIFGVTDNIGLNVRILFGLAIHYLLDFYQ